MNELSPSPPSSPTRPCFVLTNSIYWQMIHPNHIEQNEKIFKHIHISRNSQLYKIIGYNPTNMTEQDIESLGYFKSLIFNGNNRLLCFAPPKAMPYDFFKKKYKKKTNYIIAEEWLEGMMINVFWDESVGFGGTWEIATREGLYGGEYTFFSNKKKVHICFKEACDACNLDINMLDKNICYSFLMQHPEDVNVVTPFKEIRIYLIEMYEIQNREDGAICVYPYYKYEHSMCHWLPKTYVKMPNIIEWETDHFDDLKRKYENTNMPYFIKGVVIRDELSGLRTQIKNVNHSIAKDHYGAHLEKQYYYLKLRHLQKVNVFLELFPDDKSEFDTYQKEVQILVQTMYKNYITSFIKKEKKLHEYDSYLMRNHLFEIHKIYKKDCKPENKYITYSIVEKYVNQLEPYELMLFINEPVLESKKDFGFV